jgi:hypothetical protein
MRSPMLSRRIDPSRREFPIRSVRDSSVQCGAEAVIVAINSVDASIIMVAVIVSSNNSAGRN